MMAYSVGAVPLFNLFLDKESAPVRMISIGGYDWVEFARVLKSVNSIIKDRIHYVAEPLIWQMNGDEGEFWRCVSGASL
ncbi:hypothetical protein VA7868_04573 [Vibrio aerogenes CECT 7868]|uniref:Uncharacterized protein n=1 Tax=Vibrio aerogenes CECT 7868 TaxID=1216006 RepID=A0A1M6F3V5_9VIBR|nr:hypothetical protein [Vibrio aerogenes]SHI92343.1 hypothetical protein VA7868_04573 [Vibrio aerogenes CECT 7868]